MPTIRKVRMGSHEDKEGFIVTWEFRGFQKDAAKFRAVAMTAMRFPTTVTAQSIIAVDEPGGMGETQVGPDVVSTADFGPRDYNVEVFVPTKGIGSVGIQNPVKWARESFGDRFQD